MGHTITIRLPKELLAWLDDLSTRTGQPRGRIIREQLERAKADRPDQAFMQLAGTVEGPRNLSRRKGFSRA